MICGIFMPPRCCWPVSRCMWSPHGSATLTPRSPCASTLMWLMSSSLRRLTLSRGPLAHLVLLANPLAKGPPPGGQRACELGALGGTRTPNLLIRSQMLYPLSYERWCLASLRHSERALCQRARAPYRPSIRVPRPRTLSSRRGSAPRRGALTRPAPARARPNLSRAVLRHALAAVPVTMCSHNSAWPAAASASTSLPEALRRRGIWRFQLCAASGLSLSVTDVVAQARK